MRRPFALQPAVKEFQARLGLVEWDHMSASEEAHEGEVTAGLHLTDNLARAGVVDDGQVLHFSRGKFGMVRVLERLCPGLVAQPVADEIGITGIKEDGHLSNESRNETVERLHPVAAEEEVAVNIHVAGIVGADFGAQRIHHLGLVQIFADILQLGVAEIAAFAVGPYIIGVAASALVRADDCVVAVDRSGNAGPRALAVVASFNHGKTTGQSIIHGLAAGWIQHRWVSTFTTGHGSVVWVLGERISQPISNQNGLEVDVAVLMSHNLGSKYWDIMSRIGFTCNMEVLLGILRKLLEEQRKKGINILSSSNCIADRVTTVGVPNVDWLIEENNGRVRVPRVRVVLHFQLFCDR